MHVAFAYFFVYDIQGNFTFFIFFSRSAPYPSKTAKNICFFVWHDLWCQCMESRYVEMYIDTYQMRSNLPHVVAPCRQFLHAFFLKLG